MEKNRAEYLITLSCKTTRMWANAHVYCGDGRPYQLLLSSCKC